MTKIDQKIVGYSIVDPDAPKPALLQRPEVLDSKTYRLKTPLAEHALYITISDLVVDGQRRPFEIFINSKAMEHYQWIVALTRLISATFRTSMNPSLVISELKETFDPRGGYFKHGRMIPSLVAEIGGIIEQHLQGGKEPQKNMDKSAEIMEDIPDPETGKYPAHSLLCPECLTKAVVKLDGCMTCLNCGFGKCG